MRIISFIRPLILLLAAATITVSCKSDKKENVRSTLTWQGVEQDITYAAFFTGDHLNPYEYILLETRDYRFKLILPIDYLGNTSRDWALALNYTLTLKSKTPGVLNLTITDQSQSPDPKIVGGKFRCLPAGNDRYIIDINAHIQHPVANVPQTDQLLIKVDGRLEYDKSINEYEED